MNAPRRKQCDLSPGERCLWGPLFYKDENGMFRPDPRKEVCKRCKTERVKRG